MEKLENKNQVSEQEIIKREIKEFHINHCNLIHKNDGVVTDFYSFEKQLGKGGLASVKLAKNKQTQRERAIKILNKNILTDRQIRQSIKEIIILRKLDHPNIAQIHEYFEDDDFIYIVEDYYIGGELVDKILNDGDEYGLSENNAATILKHVVAALAHCHKNNIAYRDLKPENIMLTDNTYQNLKLVDFGLSYYYKKGEVMTEKVGTPYYVAPEVLDGAHNEKCDIWSAGVLLYLLLVGYPPFDGETDQEIFQKVRLSKYELKECGWQDISAEAKDLISKMLEPDFNKRLSAEQVLNHPFIKNNNLNLTPNKTVMKQSFENLKKYKRGSKLQEAIYSFIVDNIISKKEKQKLLECFNAVETKGQGYITRDELIEAYKKLNHHDPNNKEQLNKFLKDLDDHQIEEKINFSEWINKTVEQQMILSKENLDAAFKLFDKDGDGQLSVADVKSIFSGCCNSYHNETWELLIKEMDKNNNNFISKEDFFNSMQKHIYNQN